MKKNRNGKIVSCYFKNNRRTVSKDLDKTRLNMMPFLWFCNKGLKVNNLY